MATAGGRDTRPESGVFRAGDGHGHDLDGEFGAALGVSWLVTLGRYEAWLALAMWAVAALAMGAAFAKRAQEPAAARLRTVAAGTTGSRGRRKRSAERKTRARHGTGSSAGAADA